VAARVHPSQAPGLPATSLLQRAVAAVGWQAVEAELSKRADRHALRYSWPILARPEQLAPPGDWTWWMLSGGRGSGKTRSGAEMVRVWARDSTARIGILGKTPDDVRRDLLEGPSGLMQVCPPSERPTFQASVSGGELTWPNGAKAFLLSGAHPAGIRGVNLTHAWVDELPHFKYPRLAWDNLGFALRLGRHVQGVITTTPLAIKLMHELMQRDDLVYSRASTYANRANLADNFFRTIIAKYEGTRFGRQEIHGELLEDVPGALWKSGVFRVVDVEPDALELVAVAIDPAASSGEDAAETGIVSGGRFKRAGNEAFSRFALLGDASLQGSPEEWARAAINEHDRVGAELFVVEVNQGGDMVSSTLRSAWQAMGRPGAPRIHAVHASKGKRTRAEPISALYEQGRVSHVSGLSGLEDQMTLWSATSGEKSPDRMDAAVWLLTELSVEGDTGKVEAAVRAPTRVPPLRAIGM
jgi:phage terminase large subunit-like protein